MRAFLVRVKRLDDTDATRLWVVESVIVVDPPRVILTVSSIQLLAQFLPVTGGPDC